MHVVLAYNSKPSKVKKRVYKLSDRSPNQIFNQWQWRTIQLEVTWDRVEDNKIMNIHFLCGGLSTKEQ